MRVPRPPARIHGFHRRPWGWGRCYAWRREGLRAKQGEKRVILPARDQRRLPMGIWRIGAAGDVVVVAHHGFDLAGGGHRRRGGEAVELARRCCARCDSGQAAVGTWGRWRPARAARRRHRSGTAARCHGMRAAGGLRRRCCWARGWRGGSGGCFPGRCHARACGWRVAGGGAGALWWRCARRDAAGLR